MSICFSLDSALPAKQTLERISRAQEKYGEVLSHFWISDINQIRPHIREDDAEYGFDPKCTFLVQWNKERSELIQRIPEIFYDVFDAENILIRDNDYEVVPPP